MIAYWHHRVVRLRPSVRPSVRPSALWFFGSVYRAKSCASVFPGGKFLFAPSDTYCTMYRLATKMHPKKLVEENANVSFFHTQKTTRALGYNAVLLIT